MINRESLTSQDSINLENSYYLSCRSLFVTTAFTVFFSDPQEPKFTLLRVFL